MLSSLFCNEGERKCNLQVEISFESVITLEMVENDEYKSIFSLSFKNDDDFFWIVEERGRINWRQYFEWNKEEQFLLDLYFNFLFYYYLIVTK